MFFCPKGDLPRRWPFFVKKIDQVEKSMPQPTTSPTPYTGRRIPLNMKIWRKSLVTPSLE